MCALVPQVNLFQRHLPLSRRSDHLMGQDTCEQKKLSLHHDSYKMSPLLLKHTSSTASRVMTDWLHKGQLYYQNNRSSDTFAPPVIAIKLYPALLAPNPTICSFVPSYNSTSLHKPASLPPDGKDRREALQSVCAKHRAAPARIATHQQAHQSQACPAGA